MLKNFLHRLVTHPCIYDCIQYIFGFKKCCQRLAPYLAQAEGQVVLDLGAGTGLWAPSVPQSATYIWLDSDPQKMQGFRSKQKSGKIILGDVTKICFKDKSIDYALSIVMSHHLSDEELNLFFSEVARVVKKKFIFLDAIECKESKISNLLWKYDRGSFPRSMQALRMTIERYFEIENTECFSVYHYYIYFVVRPKTRVGH